jgi:hypothetical protein
MQALNSPAQCGAGKRRPLNKITFLRSLITAKLVELFKPFETEDRLNII